MLWLSAAELNTYCGDGSRLGVHPEYGLRGVDFASGSLGQVIFTFSFSNENCAPAQNQVEDLKPCKPVPFNRGRPGSLGRQGKRVKPRTSTTTPLESRLCLLRRFRCGGSEQTKQQTAQAPAVVEVHLRDLEA